MVLFLSGASAALPQSTGFSHLRDAACLNEFCFCSCNSFNADGRSLPHVTVLFQKLPSNLLLHLDLSGRAQIQAMRRVKRGD